MRWSQLARYVLVASGQVVNSAFRRERVEGRS